MDARQHFVDTQVNVAPTLEKVQGIEADSNIRMSPDKRLAGRGRSVMSASPPGTGLPHSRRQVTPQASQAIPPTCPTLEAGDHLDVRH
jgi:hypothetical protein